MKEIQTIATAQNFSAINLGKLNQISEYELHLGPNVVVPGKVFGGAALHATGGDFSFQVFPAGQRPVSCTRTRTMRSCISSWAERVSFRWTGKCSMLRKAAWCAWLPQANARYATTAMSR